MAKKKITVILKGGLGNQLFQYATARNIAINNNTELILDTSSGFIKDPYKRVFALSVFSINSTFFSSTRKKITILDKIKKAIKIKLVNPFFKIYNVDIVEKSYAFDETIRDLRINQSVTIEGYFHSEKYFENIKNILSKELTFNEPPNHLGQKYLNNILIQESVSMHIRKYDNPNTIDTSSINGICSIEYYERAIEYIKDKLNSPCFYIFSDDIEWTKTNIKISGFSVNFIDHNGPDKSHEDLRLMTACKHNIIANSSFSWWGAWLNNNPDKIVIAPKQWLATDKYDYKDVVPETWLKF